MTQTTVFIASIAPFIAGVAISRLGLTRIYSILAFLLIFSRVLTAVSYSLGNWWLFVAGELFFRISRIALFMAQMYIVIKYFKGKELSFALGVSAWASLIPYTMAFNLSAQLYAKMITPERIFVIGVGACFLSVISLMILNKIEAGNIREEEERPMIGEDYTMTRRVILLLGVAIICLFEANYYSIGVIFELGRYKIPTNGIINIGKAVMLPLAGLLTDRMKKIPVVLAGIIMAFIGALMLSLSTESTRNIFLYISSFLVVFGDCFFEVSSWACIGNIAPSRLLGPALGLIHSGIGIGSFLAYMGSYYSFFVLVALIALLAALVLVVFASKIDKSNGGKIDFKSNEKSLGTAGATQPFIYYARVN